jgi:rare lipoprotein A
VRKVLKLSLLVAVFTLLLASPAQANVSCYGGELAGNPTASGEPFDPSALTAAHPSLPFGTVVSVTEPVSGATVDLVINDRGPFTGDRSLDMSCGAMQALGLPIGVYPLTWNVV